MQTSVEVTVAITDNARVGEGPVWDDETRRLCWVDILGGAINTSDVDGSRRHTVTLPTLVGAVAPKVRGGFVAATAEGFADVSPDGTATTRLRVLPDGQRMNDAKCDSVGRLWAGSTELGFLPGQGALHVLFPDWRSETVLTGLTLPNGLGWSPDDRTFYLVDSIARELSAYDVLPDQLVPANGRVLARFPEGTGLPDGLTVDTDGCLWVAMWGGGRLVRLSAEGQVLDAVLLPVEQPSSCTFGGPDLDVLYVTSAREGLDLALDDVAGSVLAIRGTGATGLPVNRFRG